MHNIALEIFMLFHAEYSCKFRSSSTRIHHQRNKPKRYTKKLLC